MNVVKSNPTEEERIVNSLEYLLMESKKSNNKRVANIIESSIDTIRSRRSREIDIHDFDPVSEFLVRFVNLDQKTQKTLVNEIEKVYSNLS